MKNSNWTTTEAGKDLPEDGIPLLRGGQGRTAQEIQDAAILWGLAVVGAAGILAGAIFWWM